MKTRIIINTLLVIAVICLPSLLHAQPGFGGAEDVVDTPVDGGLTLLVAAGVGYGAKKLRDKRRK